MALSIEQLNANRAKIGLAPLPNTQAPETSSPVPSPLSFANDAEYWKTKQVATEVKKQGGPINKLKEIGEKRGTEVLKSIKAFSRGEQPLSSTISQTAGQVLGGASDILGATVIGALKTVTPKPIENAVSSGATRAISSLMSTRPGQFVSQQTQKLEADTEKTRNIKAFLGAGSLGLDLTGFGVGAKAGQRVAKEVAEQVEKRAVAQIPKKIQKIEKLYEKAADVAPSTKKAFEERFQQPFSKYLAQEQIPLDVAPGNILDATESLKKVDNILDIEEKNLQNILSTKPGTNNLNDLAQKVVKQTEGLLEEREISKWVNKFLLSRKEKVLDNTQFNALKRQFNKYYDGSDVAKNEAARLIQRVMRQEMLDKFPNDKMLQDTLARMSKHLEAREALGKMSGKVIRGGKLGKQLNQIVGASVFSRIPVLGPILGYELAGRLTDYMLNPRRLTEKAIKQLHALKIVPETLKKRDEVLNYLKNDLQKRLVGEKAPLMLKEATSETPIRVGAPDTSGIIKDAPAPTQLPVEPRPGQIQIPQNASPQPIITTPPTTFEPRAKKIGNAIEGRIVESKLVETISDKYDISKSLTAKIVDSIVKQQKKQLPKKLKPLLKK